MTDKKLKGDIAEASVIAECIKRGYKVSVPFGDRFAYDIILDVNNKLFKIQIKSVYLSSENRLQCSGAKRSLTNRVTTKYKKYNKGDFDFVIAYYQETNDFYIIPDDIFLESSSDFRLSKLGTQRKMKNNPELLLNNWSLLE